MRKGLIFPIFVSLIVIVLVIVSQQITMALYFLPLNNSILSQGGENMTNQTTMTASNNQTSTPPTAPLPLPVGNQTTTTASPKTPPTAPSSVNNQITTAAAPSNPSLLSYIDPTFNFKIAYPSNLTKYGVLNLNLHKITNIGHESLVEVAFGLPNSNKTFFAISIGRDSGNLLLKDYVKKEINLLSKYIGFKPLESSDISLGGNTAHKIVYGYGVVKNGIEVNQGKSMEIITMHNTWPIFIEYRGSLSDYPKYLPIAQKIIDSFQFIK